MILAFALIKLLLHLVTAPGYGYFRDELYYLACTEHLALGYVDHPALSILPLWLVRHTLGTSLLAIRFLPALAGSATVALVGWMAKRMGGGKLAQALAMTSALIAGTYLGMDHFYSMNAFDILLWAAAGALLIRLLAEPATETGTNVASSAGQGRIWIALGFVLALGLANKISVLWLGAGLGAGLLLGPQRKTLATRWPWIAGALALLGAVPYLVWQLRNGWPTREFVHNATHEKMLHVSPVDFLHGQLDAMNPFTLPIWLGGLAWLLFAKRGARFRLLAWIYAVVFAILLANGASRASYLAPAYTWLFAAGGAGWESWLRRQRKDGAPNPWLPRLGWALVVLLVAGGVLVAPFALPILPVDTYIRYAKALGQAPDTEERHELGELPQFYADMQGWPAISRTVTAVYEALPPEERARARAFAPDYGVAGALDLFGRAEGLPPALSGHNNYWLWGPGTYVDGPLVVVGGSREKLDPVCTRLEQAATIECGRCMPYENHRPVWLCHGLKMPIAELWPKVKHFD
jgi:4-amino-4-deoxy-L-arabinose transferase-like glycosyltransferase